MSTFSHHSRSSRGFTLIELLVVMTIMVIVTALALFNQSRFDSSTLLRSLAYSVALSVRQAQVYGGSVLGTTTISSNCGGSGYYASGVCYASAYGIDFTSGTAGSYILFADTNGNGKYDAGEAAKVFNFNTGYSINTVCGYAGGGSAWYCTAACPASLSSCNPNYISQLDIVFRRPNPDACFSTNLYPAACSAGGTAVYSSAYVQISGGDNTRSVTVSSTGEISVGGPGT